MKLYAKNISETLPDWVTVVTKSADLIEIEINDEHPSFQSLLEELETEIEPGTIGVKAEDLCSRLGIEMSNPNLCQLLEQAKTLISFIATHPDYKQLLNEGYQPDLNIADASTALTYLQWELERNHQVRRWHLKNFFDNPPQHLKKRIASIDSEAINYLLGRKA